MVRIETAEFNSPIGPLGLAAEAGVLIAVTFNGLGPLRVWARRILGEVGEMPAQNPGGASTALRRFFDGELDALAELPVRFHGTAFQARVWRSLRRIPVGTTRTYRELAQWVGDGRATRAVGAANGQNPLPVVVPCHRVIGSDGGLTGFGGGLSRKRWLLEHEGALRRQGSLL
jgi:methylated-DNA-[protein]-cysteine S-methyltransferase